MCVILCNALRHGIIWNGHVNQETTLEIPSWGSLAIMLLVEGF